MSEALDAMIDFALVTTSRVLAAAQSVVLTLKGDVNPDTVTSETVPDCEVWGEPALLWRPAAPDAAGSCEVAVVRRGDTLEVIGGRERRWQVTLEEGDVVLRAFGPTAAKIRLKPNGNIELGIDGVQQFIALGQTLQTFVNVFWPPASGGSWTPVPNDGGLALQNALIAAFATPPTVASAKHKVET